jgi:DNA replication protein DnaC
MFHSCTNFGLLSILPFLIIGELLIIDDFGLQPLDGQNRNMLLEIMEDRRGNRSTIITSQLPVAKWYDIIGEQTIADAILDRIVHDAHRIELNGESLRKRYGMKKGMNIITMQ